MRHALRIALAAVAVSVIAAPSFAQGRHDEKPHGMKKATTTASASEARTGTGGRHDEGPTSHGRKKVEKKDDARTPEAAK